MLPLSIYKHNKNEKYLRYYLVCLLINTHLKVAGRVVSLSRFYQNPSKKEDQYIEKTDTQIRKYYTS
jgi:hypothetical protein